MESPTFYLSEDKRYLMDEHDSNMYGVVQENEQIYYTPIAIESEAFNKVCVNSTPVKVCNLWSPTHECLAFEYVYVCTQWELVPNGYSNIS